MLEISELFVQSAAAAAAGYTFERRPPRPEDGHVLAHALNWLSVLPKGVRPLYLATEFPRILNDLARLWADTVVLDLYFEDMEFSPREDRRGFSPLVKEELLALHVYSLRTRATLANQHQPPRALQRALQP